MDIKQMAGGSGSGPAGRILRADVEAFLAAPPQPAAAAEAAVVAAPSVQQAAVLAVPDAGAFEDLTPGSIRKVIARNTTLSKTVRA